MLKNILNKLFGDQQSRAVKKVDPILQDVLDQYATLQDKSDDEIRARVIEIRKDIQEALAPLYSEVEEIQKDYLIESDEMRKEEIGNHLDQKRKEVKTETQKVLDFHLPEVYAIVRDTCRRLAEEESDGKKGHLYLVRGTEERWFMVPFEVQIIGGIALHQGKIAEMATGEGKTLVAVFPLFLNSLVGRGVHLVTVNDYLASRDSEWMRPVFDFHGITVGVITTQMDFADRQANYACDITYGMNSEFGFDYLRDNMATHPSQLVQRELYYAIVDEVDSILIDEARTPLIISGPVAESKDYYKELKPYVARIVQSQTMLCNRLVNEARSIIESENPDYNEVGRLLLLVKRGAPKNKQYMKLTKEADNRKLVSDIEGFYLRDKKMHILDEELYYVIEENSNSAELCDKGRDEFSKLDRNLFIMEQIDDVLKAIDDNEQWDIEEKARRKNKATQDFLDKNEKLHNIKQLVKAYALFEKDNEYVVQDNKVMIVDEFTGRLMPGRRFSDGLHQALEAKEDVTIEGATQTLATITLQNYFRMFDKLAGMTGTAITEDLEFMEIYKLPVMVIPTNEPITRIDHDDVIYLTKLEKYKAIIEEIDYWHKQSKPVLVGTVSVEVSETLSRLLTRRSIKHSVLNAKQHEREAEIIKDAGRPGAVTIATNMAGRGTDIKLGTGVITQTREIYQKMEKGITAENPYGLPQDGLHVIGTERHESRRIDRQLRGRAGRQGDPGTSRFYLSLEDDLMRLFGSDRIAPMMRKVGVKEGDAITHPWMTKSVENAQKRVEAHNFDIRKNLIKYDEVMNQQREVIYKFRRNALKGYDLKTQIGEMIRDTVANVVDDTLGDEKFEENWNLPKLLHWFRSNIGVETDEETLLSRGKDKESLTELLTDITIMAYERKEETVTTEQMREIERRVLLEVVDDQWRDHMHEMDILKDGIGMRAYANKDPLIEFKRESFDLFQSLITRIYEQVTIKVFTTYLITREQMESMLRNARASHNEMSVFGPNAVAPTQPQHPSEPGGPEEDAPKQQPVHVAPKIGRNDPCPCGSGKKYKKCCGAPGNE
jgi:preprotein translocase subunit SecA